MSAPRVLGVARVLDDGTVDDVYMPLPDDAIVPAVAFAGREVNLVSAEDYHALYVKHRQAVATLEAANAELVGLLRRAAAHVRRQLEQDGGGYATAQLLMDLETGAGDAVT